MIQWPAAASTYGGRPAITALGGLYVVLALGLAYTELTQGMPVSNVVLLSLFVAGPGAILLYGSHTLPDSTITPKFYPTITKWCLGGVIIITGLLVIYHLVPPARITQPVRAFTVISAFVVVPAFIGGRNAAKAKSRELELTHRNLELEELHAELESTIEQLRQSNERLEQFAYAASHDLQEPARTVASFLQLIERRYAGVLDEEGQEFLEYARGGADRMHTMIDALLTYSRVESQGQPLTRVDLNDVVADACTDLDALITKSGAEIHIEALPAVSGDAVQLGSLFQNLLRNAIQYSGGESPVVRVSSEQTSTDWTVSVADEGIGIEPSEHERIFEIFHRLHLQDDVDGSGIGLALCERIVDRHGGKIWVESEPGKGATFSFTLPHAGDLDD